MGSNLTAMENGTSLEMIRDLDRGDFVLDLDNACKQAVNSVMDNGKKASVTIALEFQFDGETQTMKVVPDLKVNLAKKKKRGAMFFVTPERNLSRADPRQQSMFPDGN